VLSDIVDTVRSEIKAFVREPLGDRTAEHVSHPNSEQIESLAAAKLSSNLESTNTPSTEPVLLNETAILRLKTYLQLPM